MYTYEKLTHVDRETLYRAFLAAFSDYQVKLDLSYEAFQNMMKRRGLSLDISVGVFAEPQHQLVGFILNGLRMWKGQLTAYDLGTGVIPAHRKQGLSRELFQMVVSLLPEKQVSHYLLEVIQTNEAAYNLYVSQGLEVVAEYHCFQGDRMTIELPPMSGSITLVTELSEKEWQEAVSFWDFSPSWQNTIASIQAVKESFAYAVIYGENQLIGYGIVDKTTGDVPQLAVRRDYRRMGFGTLLIAMLLEQTTAEKLSVLNVMGKCESMNGFLTKLGFRLTVKQYEMVRSV